MSSLDDFCFWSVLHQLQSLPGLSWCYWPFLRFLTSSCPARCSTWRTSHHQDFCYLCSTSSVRVNRKPAVLHSAANPRRPCPETCSHLIYPFHWHQTTSLGPTQICTGITSLHTHTQSHSHMLLSVSLLCLFCWPMFSAGLGKVPLPTELRSFTSMFSNGHTWKTLEKDILSLIFVNVPSSQNICRDLRIIIIWSVVTAMLMSVCDQLFTSVVHISQAEVLFLILTKWWKAKVPDLSNVSSPSWPSRLFLSILFFLPVDSITVFIPEASVIIPVLHHLAASLIFSDTGDFHLVELQTFLRRH